MAQSVYDIGESKVGDRRIGSGGTAGSVGPVVAQVSTAGGSRWSIDTTDGPLFYGVYTHSHNHVRILE